MLKLITHILKNGVATATELCPPLEEDAAGMPIVTQSPCINDDCRICAELCPTNAISVNQNNINSLEVELDLGSCIGCQLCVDNCPSGTIVNSRSTRLAKERRSELILSNKKDTSDSEEVLNEKNVFRKSLHARVISTGCSACDLELGATSNPIFDLERFGVTIVASPRFADALIVTGPVGKGMRDPLLRCYAAMPEPRIVIALGTCAISGGVHKNGYAEANGLDKILPVDVYIPGCPPHPWSIIHGISLAMGKRC